MQEGSAVSRKEGHPPFARSARNSNLQTFAFPMLNSARLRAQQRQAGFHPKSRFSSSVKYKRHTPLGPADPIASKASAPAEDRALRGRNPSAVWSLANRSSPSEVLTDSPGLALRAQRQCDKSIPSFILNIPPSVTVISLTIPRLAPARTLRLWFHCSGEGGPSGPPERNRGGRSRSG